MQVLANHLVGIDRGALILFSDVEDGGAMWTGDGPRLVRQTIRFARPFHGAPTVMLTAEMWDYHHCANLRGDLSAEAVTAESFDAVFKTWGDTRIARLRVGWLAIGAVPDPEAWEL